MKPALRKLRRLFFWLLALLLLLTVAEGAATLWLRGRSTHYVVSGESNGNPVWTENPFFPCRFVLPRAAEPPPPLVASRDDADRPFRVCVLTDSTPLGLGGADFSFPRQLEHLLRVRCPDVPVEVLHMTQRGANSHVLREIARDLRILKPDAVVVMCGNDEINGPYGPAAAPVWAPAPLSFHLSPNFARPLVLFSRLRLAQAIAILAGRCFPDRVDRDVWTSREPLLMRGRLPAGSPGLDAARDAYGDNLDAIFSLASAASPVVIACTTPVNLRDCGPLATPYSRDSETAQLNREALFRAIANEADFPDEAERLYESVLLRNPSHAEALYRSGRLALRRGRADVASRRLAAARDHDLFRLRCDSTFNRILDDAADRAGVELLDVEGLFASLSPDGIPGREFFLDPVHMTFEGHYRLAEAILVRLESIGALPDSSPSSPVLPSPGELADAMLYQPWDRAAALEAARVELLHPPFRNQPGQPEALALIAAEKAALDAQITALPPANALAIHVRHRQLHPDDPWLAARAARWFLRAGRCDEAADAADAALRIWPRRLDIRSLRILADILRSRCDQFREIERLIRRAKETDPELAAAEDELRTDGALAVESRGPSWEIRRDADDFEDALRDTLNERLGEWAEALPPEEVSREDVPWPADIVQSVRDTLAAERQALAAFEAASNALATASAALAEVTAEHAEAIRKADELAADLERAQAMLNTSRAGVDAGRDPMEAAQALSDNIRRTDRIQSEQLAAKASIQIIDQRLAAAKEERDAKRRDANAAEKDLQDAGKERGGAVRDLRRAYLKAREKRVAEEPDTGDDRVDWFHFPDLWGPVYPEVLAFKARTSRKASNAAKSFFEKKNAAMLAGEDAHLARRRELALRLARELRDSQLPVLLDDYPVPEPFDASAALAIGTFLRECGRPNLALPWFRFVLERNPGDADAALLAAVTLRDLEALQESIDTLEATVERLPSDPVLWEELGLMYCYLRRHEESDDAFERAATLAPYHYDRFYRRAWALEEIAEHVRAYRTLQQYLELAPPDAKGERLRLDIIPSLPEDFDFEEKPAASSKPSLLDTLKE